MQGHTHGRWYVDGHEIKVLRPEREQLGAGAAETVCTMESSLPPAETVANARLMSAAPELLEALEKLERVLDGPIGDILTGDAMAETGAYAALTTARAAIARAKGVDRG